MVLQLLYEISSPLPIPRYRTHSLLLCRLSCGRGPDSTDSQVLPGSHAEPAAIPWSPLPTGDQSSLPILKRVIAGISRAHLTRGFAPKNVITRNSPNPRPDPQHPVPATRTREHPCMGHCCQNIFRLFSFGRVTGLITEIFQPIYYPILGRYAVDCRTSPSMVKLLLRCSKCDQFGKGVDIVMGCTDTPLCPVVAILDYIRLRQDHPRAFFRMEDGTPTTKGWFSGKLRGILSSIGLPRGDYADHSFRIGAVTTAAMVEWRIP